MRQELFHTHDDYIKFIYYVENLIISYSDTIKVYIYCLLPNHFHFLLQQTVDWFDISDFMRKLQVSYANYYKAKYKKKRWIPLFEWRFHAKLLENDEYLLACYNYISYNPIKHNLVDTIDKRQYLFPKRPVA